ncbi:unnamed protein product [Bursaphelenchus okinawaensis]|uniref:Vacuolar protein sorting-associated protein 52 homolog n=1 Tax=Bursaphelenchus okinawaensis TaxID=465554 RepID=A0A811LI98_9BILA|nr:unnamed protein product [Bursaphelenchus okinawaensis]CAG9124255.1 unnamed protein product [Bursaphelenchus okinawaensis]
MSDDEVECQFNIEDEFVKRLIESEVDLRDHSTKVETQLRGSNRLVVEDCIDHAEELVELNEQITECDQTFENLEGMLSNFLAELGTISEEMKRLQDQSVVINQQLHNRQRVRGELSQFVDDMVVPHSMIKIIMEQDVNSSEFLEQLHELQHKLQFLKAQAFKDAKAVEDVQDVIENLKFKAMEKMREWLLAKISLFKKPLTNYQIPQSALLRNRFFYEFLLANERAVAREIKDEYTDAVSKMFFSYFKTYVSRLFKLQMPDSATKEDLLGAEDAPKTGYPNLQNIFGTKVQTRSKATVFSLGTRDSLLTTDFLSPLIVPHAALQAGEQYQFESLFRSIQYALVDHCSHEFLFLCDFFMVEGQSAVDLFSEVMERSIVQLQKSLEEKINANYDAISLFLCICLCTKYSELMAERSVISIDNYLKTMAQLLWTRFEHVMGLHTDSLRSLDAKKMSTDNKPHYVVRRYAEFLSAFLVCINLSGKKMDERLQNILTKQEQELEGFLYRYSQQMKRKKDRLVFQINNYDVILTVLDEKVLDESKERTEFCNTLQTKTRAFVEEVLFPHFNALIQFVNEVEPHVEQGHTQQLSRFTGKVTQIVRAFVAEWKKSIEEINKEILQSFTNFKVGSTVLQAVFTQFVNYYQRFNKLLYHEAFSQCTEAKSELVGAPVIIAELKKYKPIY